MTNPTATAAPAPGTRVRIVGFAPDYDGLTGVVEGQGSDEFADWTAVRLDRRATAAESALLFRPQFLAELPEPTVSLVKAAAAPAQPGRAPAAPGHHLAALPALLALTPAQRVTLAAIAQDDQHPGMGLHAARRQVLEAAGLVTSQRVGTGRGAWTRVDLTDLGQDVAALELADQRAQELADAANEAQDAKVRAANRAAADADDHAAELDDEDATDAAGVVWCDTPDHPATGHTRHATCLRPTDTPDDEDADQAAEGTYATLDEAEHGQPLASLDRLAELALENADGQPAPASFRALVRDHVSTVRARIAELEAPAVDDVAAAVQDPAWGREPAADTIARLNEHPITHRERRITELETQLRTSEDRAAGWDAESARAHERIAELERRLEQSHHDYARARRRITELEDAPIRQLARRLVEALTDMRDPNGEAVVSLPVSRAWLLLADALGIDTSQPLAVAPTHPTIGGDPRRALAALGIQVRPGLPGEAVEVREYAATHGHVMPKARIIGYVTDGVFRTDVGRGAREIPAGLVPAYVDRVRHLGQPAVTVRRLVYGEVLAEAECEAAGQVTR